MNELTELETQLRSWAPRPPSAKLERQLFASPLTDRESAATQRQRRQLPEGHYRAPLRLGWLASAFAALVFLFVMYGQHDGDRPGSASSGPFLALISSNQSAN